MKKALYTECMDVMLSLCVFEQTFEGYALFGLAGGCVAFVSREEFPTRHRRYEGLASPQLLNYALDMGTGVRPGEGPAITVTNPFRSAERLDDSVVSVLTAPALYLIRALCNLLAPEPYGGFSGCGCLWHCSCPFGNGRVGPG